VRQSRHTAEVHKVKPGLIEEWNKANPAQAVFVGDQLIEVNGVSGPTTREMLYQFQADERLVLLFVRKDVFSEFITI